MHARTFLCRETLWQQLEEIAREQGASMDDVIADAMRAYARQRQYGGAGIDEGYERGAAPPGGLPNAHDYDRENAPDLARTNAVRPVSRRPPSMSGGGPPPSRGMPLPPPPTSRAPGRPMTSPMPAAPPPRHRPAMPSGGAPLAPPSRGMASMGGAPSLPSSMPPPPARGPARGFPAPADSHGAPRGRGAPRLTLSYEGNHLEVAKERFILGRSKTQADLVLEDPNVSRQHAAIERVGNEWVLVDLGSTNGCYVDGARVSRRPLEDGDIIEITTHQVRCTLG
ncbi:MAG: Adenylate cyclase [Labilithrix sp.]|nr:Adenylate cyclase [Labilithrix sp.]